MLVDFAMDLRLAECLMAYCAKLEYLCILSTCMQLRTKSGIFQAKFEELRKQFPNAMVYVDEEPPTWPGQNWCFEKLR